MLKSDLLFVSLCTLMLVLAPTPPEAHDLYGLDVFNTKPFACGEEKRIRWVNHLGDVRIYQSQVWMGMYAGDVADLAFQVNAGDNILHRGNWDHYRDPSGINNQIQLMNWTPNYIELNNGEWLDFTYGCYKTGTAEIVVTVWIGR